MAFAGHRPSLGRRAIPIAGLLPARAAQDAAEIGGLEPAVPGLHAAAPTTEREPTIVFTTYAYAVLAPRQAARVGLFERSPCAVGRPCTR